MAKSKRAFKKPTNTNKSKSKPQTEIQKLYCKYCGKAYEKLTALRDHYDECKEGKGKKAHFQMGKIASAPPPKEKEKKEQAKGKGKKTAAPAPAAPAPAAPAPAAPEAAQ